MRRKAGSSGVEKEGAFLRNEVEGNPDGMDIFKERPLVLEDKRFYRFMHALTVAATTLAILYPGGFDFGLGAAFFMAAILLYSAKKSFDIAFDYTVTNGELDVDIIQEQRERSTALSILVSDIELLAPLESGRYQRFPEHRTVKRMYPRESSGTEYALI